MQILNSNTIHKTEFIGKSIVYPSLVETVMKHLTYHVGIPRASN